ncbi:MAG TPA: hypothetical protein VGZ01_10340 [Trinickia sp.]|jgi:hypothetical protein|nr:hypothetical protein [Trinickia sp.]
MKTMGWVLSCVLAAGCAATNQVSPETMQQATTPLICSTDECALWWQRARDWVTHHANYALRSATDSLIETAGPAGGSGKLAYEITKTSNDDGTFTIGFAAHCDSAIGGCRPDPWRAAADFKQFVRNGVEAQPR